MRRTILATVALTALLSLSGVAHADRGHRSWDGPRYRPSHHHSHVHSRIFVDIGPLWWPAYSRYYYAPPAVVVTRPAVTYLQAPSPEPEGYWYYCRSPEGYYPYVKKCPGGWMKVVPEAPGE
jgi:hypothetical protein